MAFSAIPLFYYKEFYMNVFGVSIVFSSDFSYNISTEL